ncbi:MAG: glycerate kinase [Clostridia bacterium]|nr:glycerate kinase [Clostridia bacterium]
MSAIIRDDAKAVIDAALLAAQPDIAVKKALAEMPSYTGKLVLVAIGKAAWQMAKAAYDELLGKIDDGIVITKHGHSKGEIGRLKIREAGHPVPDEHSYSATAEAIDLVKNLCKEDMVLFLISGGGSALFEKPLIDEAELQSITKTLLASGAGITEINTIRKRFSAVKGGKFAKICSPAHVFSVVLSDIIGDPLDMIASGPSYPDSVTADDALYIAQKYNLSLSDRAKALIKEETPKVLYNVSAKITGSVKQLCLAAQRVLEEKGYETVIVSDSIDCEAKEAGKMFVSLAKKYVGCDKNVALIGGGETVVHVTGNGLGGRNQEVALSAAKEMDGMKNVLFFSLGSDGTDGPTDAAGGIVDGLTAKNIGKIDEYLENNDSYRALQKADALIFTGPTGTNVNDLMCMLIKNN